VHKFIKNQEKLALI